MARAQGSDPKVEVVLVRYNQPEMEEETIRHVLSTADYGNYSLRAHQNERGIGLPEIWNRLIGQSDAKYLVLLDTDTVPTPGWLRRMVSIAEASGAPVVVPSSNLVHMSQIEVPFEDYETNLGNIYRFAAELEDEHGDETRVLPTCSSTCALIRRSTWQDVGGFDTDFFLWGGDTEFFYRVSRKHGVLWARGVYVHHYQHRSTVLAHNDGEIDYNQQRQQAGAMWMRKKGKIDSGT